MRASDKIIDALSQLLEGFKEIQQNVQGEVGEDDTEQDAEVESSPEVEAALVTEMRGAIEAAIENTDASPEEFGELIASMTEALEEIDPDIFESTGDDDESSDLDDEDLEEIDDLDEDYDDEEFDDDDEGDEEEEEEDEEDVEEDEEEEEEEEEPRKGGKKKR